MEFVQNLIYTFTVVPHAKISFAFRYQLVLDSDSVEAVFVKRIADQFEGRIEAHIKVGSTKVRVILNNETVITALPMTGPRNFDADLIKEKFETLMLTAPDMFSLADISEWGRKFYDGANGFNRSDLNREITRRQSTRREKPNETIPEEQSTDVSTTCLVEQVVDDRLPLFSLDELYLLGIQEKYWQAIVTCSGLSDIKRQASIPGSVVKTLVKYIESKSSGKSLVEQLYSEDLKVGDSSVPEMDLESFVVELDPEQKSALNRIKGEGPYLVRGAAGTGKSLVGLYFIRDVIASRQAESLFDTDLMKIGLITYTNTLVDFNQSVLEKISPEANGFEVVSTTLDKIVYKICTMHEAVMNISILSSDGLHNWLNGIVRSSLTKQELDTLSAIGSSYVAEEIEHVIYGQNVSSLDAYRSLQRVGRQKPLNAKQRELVWKIYDTLDALCLKRNAFTFGYLRKKALSLLEAGIEYSRFKVLFIDEAQDLSKVSKQICLHLIEDPSNLVLAADTAQSIYTCNTPWSTVDKRYNFRGKKSIKLQKSYRATHEISLAIQSLILSLGEEDKNDKETSTQRNGPLPKWVDLPVFDHQEFVIDQIKEKIEKPLAGVNPSQIAIILRDSIQIQRYKAALKSAGIPASEINKNNPIDLSTKHVHLVTAHSSKGLSFPIVFVPEVSDVTYPSINVLNGSPDPQEIDNEQRLLYVALSRSSAWLYLITDKDNPSRFVEKHVQEKYWDKVNSVKKMNDVDKEKETVNYLNECIEQYLGKTEWWQLVYSLEGWAEYYATLAYDDMLESYSPKLRHLLETVKVMVADDGMVDREHIDCLINEFGLNLNEVESHLNLFSIVLENE